jgi:peptidoglycan/LPS O-acetylase OafA/YrhL
MIPGLDGLRAIAFLLVFGIHTDYLRIGWVGVQLFFVLSGFLITSILLDMKKKLPTREYFTKFYGRRFLRIFPLYYFYLFAMLAITTWLISIRYMPGAMRVFQDQVKYAFFYVYNFIAATSGFESSRLLGHFWSLSIEEQFYIIWPLLILIVPERSIKKLFLAGICAGPIFRIGTLILQRSGAMPILNDQVSIAVYTLPFSHIDAFALGAYITRFSLPHARWQLIFLGILLPLLGFSTLYLEEGTIGEISALGFYVTMPAAYQYLWAYSLLNYFFVVLIFCVIKEKLFVNFLEFKPLRYLGKISYGLYVYHFPIIFFAARIRGLGVEETLAKPLTAVIAFVATFLIASLSYFLMEKPLLNLKERFFKLKMPPAP